MGVTPAGRLFYKLRNRLPKRAFVQKIESSTGSGIPDVFICLDGAVFWVELKAGRDSLSVEQRAWMARYMDCGGDVVVYKDDGVFYLP